MKVGEGAATGKFRFFMGFGPVLGEYVSKWAPKGPIWVLLRIGLGPCSSIAMNLV